MKNLSCIIVLLLSLVSCSAQKKENAQEAVNLWTKAVKLHLENKTNKDSIAKALDLLDKAIELNRNYGLAYSQKAYILGLESRYDEVLSTLDEAIKYNPKVHGYYMMKAIKLDELKRTDEATALYQKALKICENNLKENPMTNTLMEYFFLKSFANDIEISAAEVLEAIPASTTEKDWEYISTFMHEFPIKRPTTDSISEAEKAAGIKMLKAFYTQYITNELENKDYFNDVLVGEFFLPELIGEVEEMGERSGTDNVIRAQDVNENMLKSLDVKPLDQPNWYMVSWSWNGSQTTSIPVKLKYSGNKILIDYIMPIDKGEQYGDKFIKRSINLKEAAIGVQTLKTFYTQYITNLLENKDEANKTLKSESINPDYLYDTIDRIIEFHGFDPILDAQDINENMLKTLNVKPLNNAGWYMISYSRDDKNKTSLIVKLEDVKGKMIIRYIKSLYPTLAKQQRFEKEAAELNKRALEMHLYHMSNPDTIAKALELLDKAIALDHHCFPAYTNKIALLRLSNDRHKYDKILI